MEKKIFCKSGGCSAKLGAGVLDHVLAKLPRKEDKNLLVGYDTKDDASVYKLRDDLAIVTTLDFFPAMVEDPYIFGQIAATNALSDIYAMGGEVISALNIVCFPENEDLNILGEILMGGAKKVEEAGGLLVGGHSIQDEDIKYGLNVTGKIHPDKIYQNCNVKEGDMLLLTKPLGVGILLSAYKMQALDKTAYKAMITSMTTLNRYASEIMKKYKVHACSDVTGFGFLGHLHEMLDNKYSVDIYMDNIPLLPNVYDCAKEFYITAAGQKNRNFLKDKVVFENVDFAMEEILFDPQTSGGLLISVAKEDASRLLKDIETLNLPCGIVGTIKKKREYEIYVKGEKLDEKDIRC